MGKNSYIDQNIICCVPQEKVWNDMSVHKQWLFYKEILFIFNVEDPGQEFVIINQYYFKVIYYYYYYHCICVQIK